MQPREPCFLPYSIFADNLPTVSDGVLRDLRVVSIGNRWLSSLRRKIMSSQNTSVFGIYQAYPNVERGVKVLRTAGFRDAGISELYPANTDSNDLAQEKSNKVQD